MRLFVWATFSLLLVAATTAFANTASHRLGGTGPAYWDIPCGLPCFAMAEAAGLTADEVAPAEWKHIETPADMQRLLDGRAARLEQQRGKAAVGGGSPQQ